MSEKAIIKQSTKMALAIIDTVHNYAFTISNESIQKFDPQVDYVNNKT